MRDVLPQLGLVGVLVLLNAAFAGTELALVSLREGQVQRLEGGLVNGTVIGVGLGIIGVPLALPLTTHLPPE